jgi:hypothetical protein
LAGRVGQQPVPFGRRWNRLLADPEAVAVTRSIWQPPELGMITFVDPKHVPPTMRRGQPIYGYCYLKAGFRHVGFTKGGLWAWQMLPADMPGAEEELARVKVERGELALKLAGAECFIEEQRKKGNIK